MPIEIEKFHKHLFAYLISRCSVCRKIVKNIETFVDPLPNAEAFSRPAESYSSNLLNGSPVGSRDRTNSSPVARRRQRLRNGQQLRGRRIRKSG